MARCSGRRSRLSASTCVIGLASASPGTLGMRARVPTLMNTRSPRRRRVPPGLSVTSTVLGSVNRASPMTSSAPLALNLPRWTSTNSLTIFDLRRATAAISTRTFPVTTPRPRLESTSDTAFALWMTFLLGKQATFGHEPPTIARSTTTVFWPRPANVQLRSLPATPLPMTRFSKCSAFMMEILSLDELNRLRLARLPGVAERPERNPEQGQVLDEELTRETREGGEAAGRRLPDPWRCADEAQGREEHPDCQSAADDGRPGRERANGDEDRDGEFDDAQHGRETSMAHEAVNPTHQRAVADVPTDPLRLVRRELHETEPTHHDHQAVACQLSPGGFYA